MGKSIYCIRMALKKTFLGDRRALYLERVGGYTIVSYLTKLIELRQKKINVN